MSHESPVDGIPKLPNELMIEIFHHYFSIPYEIELSEMIPYDRRSKIQDRHRSLMREMSSGSGLGYVCKTWHSLLAPFMFEWITVRRHQYLAGLLKLLRHPQRWDRDASSSRVGWYTKRLDINFEVYEAGKPERSGNTLGNIFKWLPNLEVLTIGTNPDFQGCLMDCRMLGAISPKLKMIAWSNGHGYTPKDSEDWRFFMISHPNLRVIKLPPQFSRLISLNESSEVIAPSLEHICIHAIAGGSIGNLMGPLPSLKRVTLLVFWPRLALGVASALMQYKATLSAIQFNISRLALIELAWALQPLFNDSPRLRRVDLIISGLPEPTEAMAPLPWQFPSSVAEIGVRVVNSNLPSEEAMLRFFLELTQLSRGKGIGAATIHFLDDFNVHHVLLRRHILVENQGSIITSFRRESGEMVDLLSLDHSTMVSAS